ncbi:hypothetical protein [Variovorax sp.]|uniref:hypothetical protein n=2 Tax=Pseudomonadota TaxID=1224 RepID=UPI0025D59C56|nr:hypothetical protein [Variovorax sp.]
MTQTECTKSDSSVAKQTLRLDGIHAVTFVTWWRNNTGSPLIRRYQQMSIFTCCQCSVTHLNRIQRSTWMRFFPWLRAYQCSRCGKVQLLSKRAVDEALAAHTSRVARHSGGRPADRKSQGLGDASKRSPDMS